MSNGAGPMTFLIRGESILMGFFQGFFAQETLFGQFPNPFIWDGSDSINKLTISMSENREKVNAMPAIFIQEGGYTENIRATNNDLNFDDFANGDLYYNSSFIHHYTIHCVGRNKGEAKFLQSIATRAIISFRKAIYEMGLDNISPLQGSPPMRMTSPDAQAPSQPYDCPFSFQVAQTQQWILGRTEYGDVQPEELIRLSVIAALDQLEFDVDGNITSPPEEYFRLNFTIETSP